MAKITAVIDIGSNSVRMIVCKKTSRYAFHTIYEAKSRVRISKGCYNNGGFLQEESIIRAIKALKDFKSIATNLKCRKILCVATSAVRDAPNRADFIKKLEKEIGIKAKIIDGHKEAYLGAIAASNLLPINERAVTIDIGGGSTEFALIEQGKIKKTISLNIGTIRLKELFFDKKENYTLMKNFIDDELSKLPDEFKNRKIIAIGGTARAISKIVMPKDYPLKTLHAYEYNFEEKSDFLEKIITLSVLKLKKYNIKKHRIDTIREGIAIFVNALKYLGVKDVITSGVGVREGVYLSDLLRSSNLRFPKNFNPSLRSLCDRYLINEVYANSLKENALKIFDALKELHNIDDSFKIELSAAAKLLSIGMNIDYYRYNEHTFYLIINSLNYGYTHSQKLLISFIAKYQNKKLPKEDEINKYIKLLPDLKTIQWLSFILSLSKCLHKDLGKEKYDYKLKKGMLYIFPFNKSRYLSYECIKELYKPFPLAIVLKSSSHSKLKS